MGQSLGRGHVLVMSLWDDHLANMRWLDAGTQFNRILELYSTFY